MYTLTVIVWLLTLIILGIQLNRWINRYGSFKIDSIGAAITRAILVPFVFTITLSGFYIGVSAVIATAVLVDTSGLDWRSVANQEPLRLLLLTGVIALFLCGGYNSFYYYILFRRMKQEPLKIGTYVRGIFSIIGILASIATLVAFWMEYL